VRGVYPLASTEKNMMENKEKKIEEIKSITSSLERLVKGVSRGDQLDQRYKIMNLQCDAVLYSRRFEDIGYEIARFNGSSDAATSGSETKKAINDLMENNKDFSTLMSEIEKQTVDCTLTDSDGVIRHQFFREDYPDIEEEYKEYDAIINGHAAWTDFDSHYSDDSMDISSLSHLAKIEDDIRTRTFTVITDTVDSTSVYALLDDYKKMLTIYEENLDEKEIEDLEKQIDKGVENIKQHHVSYLNTLRELLKFSNQLKMRLEKYISFSKSESLSMDLNKFLHKNNIIKKNEETFGRWPAVVNGVSKNRRSLLFIRDEAYNFIEKQISDITQLKKDIKLIISLHSTKEETTENLFNKRLKNLTESFRLLNNLKQNKYVYKIDPKLEHAGLEEIRKAYAGFLNTYKLDDGGSTQPLLHALTGELKELKDSLGDCDQDLSSKESSIQKRVVFESLDQLKNHVRDELSISCYAEYLRHRKTDCKYLPAAPRVMFKSDWISWDDLFGTKTKFTLDEKLKAALNHLEKPENHRIKQADYVEIDGARFNVGTWFASLKQKFNEKTISSDEADILSEIEQRILNINENDNEESANV
jgi:hypothetical protein